MTSGVGRGGAPRAAVLRDGVDGTQLYTTTADLLPPSLLFAGGAAVREHSLRYSGAVGRAPRHGGRTQAGQAGQAGPRL